MRKLFVLLFIFLAFRALLFSQEVNSNGFNQFFYQSGQVASEGWFRDGKPDGKWKTYYSNGNVKSEGNRKNFELDSTWNFYNEDGSLKEKIDYINGKKNGYNYKFKTTGDSLIMVSKELYVSGQKQGKAYYYNTDGSLDKVINFNNNRKHGDAWEYGDDGKIKTVVTFNYNIVIGIQKINRYDGDGNKHGLWAEYHDNGRLKQEKRYVHGVLSGLYKEFDVKGKLKKSIKYQDGNIIRNAETVSNTEVEVKEQTFANGVVKNKGAFKAGKPVGIHREYNDKGEIMSTRVFAEGGVLESKGIINAAGERAGDWEDFYPEGNKRAKGKYENNLREGKWVFYFENGKIEQQGEFRKGKPHGLWKWYYTDGKILREEEFYRGREEGQFTEFDEAGNAITKGQFADGMKQGPWFYHVGDYIEEGEYMNNLKDGKWKSYYAEGKKIMSEGKYIQGEENGRHKYYYPNGRIKMLGEYELGRRIKTWKFFDEDGNLEQTITYKNGQEIRIDGFKLK